MKTYLPEGRLSENTRTRKPLTAADLQEAILRNEILEAPAYMCDDEHNLLVNIAGVRGIIPRDEGAIGIKEGTVRDIALISRVGKAVCFTVKKLELICRVVPKGGSTALPRGIYCIFIGG